MFTGIVTDVGEVASVTDHQGSLKHIRIHCAYPAESIALGASIACSGPCLTVTAMGPREGGGAWFEVDAGAETLARTTVGGWEPGTRLNLERPLRIGDELGGHLVSGHVDGVAEIVARDDVTGEDAWGATARFTIRAPRELARFIVEKGSVALDGTSLTVNTVDGDLFTVFLIPHTLEVTTWGDRKAGARVNIEVDQMARYAARLAEARLQGY
ncbi:riboflavin synthase [Alsobacter sp. SYSU M60028]|uniref:Riboflavin synthase n=1 Tax=Alsobacter ponti TaxID=2962936 RepID=A0ABT1LA50_9HYPH|nr:riboflavin synthase [Alsobacter ponti]MCP8938355.1 riboflavin synthase [Alsobacter ponti]